MVYRSFATRSRAWDDGVNPGSILRQTTGAEVTRELITRFLYRRPGTTHRR